MPDSTIHRLCQSFLIEYFGPEEGTAGNSPAERRAHGLRLVTLGIERAVQAELVHYLRAAGQSAVAECGLLSDTARHTADIVVFDREWAPLCVIELKHFSANQGPIDALVRNMIDDAHRHAHGPQAPLPLIQLGLYTEITAAFPRETYERPFGLYRFLAAYFKGTPAHTVAGQRNSVPADFGASLTAPPAVRFEIPGATVEGRAGWLLKESEPHRP